MSDENVLLEVIEIYKEQGEALVGYWMDGCYYRGIIKIEHLSPYR